MNPNGVKIAENGVADSFAGFFDKKASNIVLNAQIDPNVYNGIRKIEGENSNYMKAIDIYECVKQLKIIFNTTKAPRQLDAAKAITLFNNECSVFGNLSLINIHHQKISKQL